MSEPMPEQRRLRARALFDQAVDLPPPERGAFLDAACRDDADLRAEVEGLLVYDSGFGVAKDEDGFLKSPLVRAPEKTPSASSFTQRRDEPELPPYIGRYRILRRLGQGGMGTVYEAEQDNPRRTVALKVIRPELVSAELVKRFSHEAQILARLHHAGIAQVYEAGVSEEGQPFFAMELILGMPLDQYASHRGLDAPARLDLLARVCDAVQHAHDRGVIHRDLKPSNILVDESGHPKVLDFGVAHVAAPDLLSTVSRTEVGQLLGTLSYMSPEQLAADPTGLDQRSDVYTLGVILFELLAQRLPYHLKQLPLHEIARVIREQEPSRLGSVNALYRGDVEIIVAKALEKDRTRRYDSAGDLASDIRRYLRGEAILARPASALYQLRKLARRHKALVVGVLGIFAALLGGTVVSILFAWRAQENARLASERELVAEEAGMEARRRGDAERWERYRSNIAAAAAAMQLQNSGSARSALDDAPTEHRNWEWQYFHSRLDGASFVLPMPGGKIFALTMSPSGKQVAVCCVDHNEAYLIDVATGRLEAVLRGHSAPATSVAYRPDGKQIATAGNDQTIRLWDPATGQQTGLLQPDVVPPNLDRYPSVAYSSDGSRIVSYPLLQLGTVTTRLWDPAAGKEIGVLGEWQSESASVLFSPDGKRVAVASRQYVYLYDAVTGNRLAALGPHAPRVEFLAYSPDGKRLAATIPREGANVIRLWDSENGKELAVLRGHTSRITSLLFSADGSRLVSGSTYPDSTAHLWDAATGRPLPVLVGHKNDITMIAMSPDGTRLATSSTDQKARLWDGHTGQLVAVLGGHTDEMRHVLFSPSGTRVVTTSRDATLRLWDAQAGELIGVLRGHGDRFVSPPVFTPDGSRLVSGSDDGTVRIWDMSLVERNGILRGHESFGYDAAFSPDGAQVVSAAWDGTARLWDATTGQPTDPLRHKTKEVTSAAYSRDGRQLVTLVLHGRLTLWDVASRKATRTWQAPATGEEPRACFNPAGTFVAAGSAAGPVRLWDVATGQEVARLEGHVKDSMDVAFHPDGSLLASTGADGTVRLWDVATRTSVAVLRGHSPEYVWRVAFSADGKLLASSSNNRTIRLWDVQTHEPLAVISMGSIVYGVAFSPDGTRLAAGCRDNTIRLIDVARRQQVAELRGHTDYVHAVSWSPDGTRLVSASGDTTVRVWDSLSAQERAKREADKPTPR
jgi:WD40 repeat protein